MNSKLRSIFDKHAAATFDKQSYLNELVAQLDWEYDIDTGLLAFDAAHQWKTQVLGTESDESGTWLWGWANEASGIPDSSLACVRSLRQLGVDNSISELTQSQMSVDELDGHFWSIVATGLCNGNAYYRGSYDGGAVYLLLKDPAFQRKIDDCVFRLATLFPQAVATYLITNHAQAFVGHAEFLNLSVQSEGSMIVVADDLGRQLTATFDERHRLTDLSGPRGTPS